MRRRLPILALLTADAVSISGNAVARVAIPWFVLERTGSASLTGLTAFFGFLPVVVAAFFGGALVDRIGFRRMSVGADVASAAAVAAIPVLDLAVGIEVWHVMALVFLGALLDAPGTTARESLLPDLAQLAGMRIERAAGLHQAVARGSVLVGAGVGGGLVALVGATSALWLDAGSFLVSALLVRALVPALASHRDPEAEPTRYLADLADGVRFVRRDGLLRAIVVTVLVTNFLDGPISPVVYPVFARDAYGSAAHLGLMMGTFAGFAFLGAVGFGAIGHRLPRRATFVSGFFAYSVTLLGLATLPPLPVTLVLLALGGLAAGPINPVLGAVEYERVPPALRGRVFGAITAGAWAAIPLGTVLGGLAVDAVGPGGTLLAIGAVYVLVTGYGFVNPAFRAMDPERDAVRAAA